MSNRTPGLLDMQAQPFSANPGASIIQGGKQAEAVDNGMQDFGHTVQRTTANVLDTISASEGRDAMVKSQELHTAYLDKLDQAYLNGTSIDAVREKFLDEQAKLEDNYSTTHGYQTAREHGKVAEHGINSHANDLNLRVYGDKVKADVMSFDSGANYFIQKDPFSFIDKLKQRNVLLDTFVGHLPPSVIDLVRAEGSKQYLKNAVHAAIKIDPDRMQELLQDTARAKGKQYLAPRPAAPQTQATNYVEMRSANGPDGQPTTNAEGLVKSDPFTATTAVTEPELTDADYKAKYPAQQREFAQNALATLGDDEYGVLMVAARQGVDAKKNDAAALMKLKKDAQKEKDEDHLNKMLGALGGQGNMADYTEDKILTDPTLSAESKLKHIDVLRKYRKFDEKGESDVEKAVFAKNGNDAYARLFLPDTDKRHIDSLADIDGMLTRKEIGPQQHRELRNAFASREKPINKHIAEVMANAKAVLVPHLPPGVTPMEMDIQARARGERALAQFRANIDAQIKEAQKDNRDVSSLFDPNKPGNMYDQLRSFEMRMLKQAATDGAAGIKEGGHQAAPATQAKPQAPGAPAGKLPTVKDQKGFDALSKGAHYYGPDGKERIK